MILDFVKGFFGFLKTANYEWWQVTILIAVVLFIILVGKFWRNVLTWIGDRLSGGKSETLQYRMFWGLTNDAINIQMKNEVRRSMKENGFCELSGNDFAQYVKNQSKILLAILKNHFINLYPPDDRRMRIQMEQVLEYLDKKDSKIEDIIFEIYIEAKRMKKQDQEDLDAIDSKFEKEIDNFIKRSNSGDCKQCFVILFGKREIAENKRDKIKTLKSQMNFAEQKLSEIHSDFLSFYSESLNRKI